MKKHSRLKKSRVSWTVPEKRSIVVAAASMRLTRPDLCGLSLLRAAVKTLPEGRRRTLISVSQVPWYEDALEAEIKTRTATSVARTGMDASLQIGESILAALLLVHGSLEDLNSRLVRDQTARPDITTV